MGTNGLEPSTSRLSGVRSNHLSYAPKMITLHELAHAMNLFMRSIFLVPNGGDEEDRTPDPLRARQVLSQLSYTPIGSRVLGYPFVLLKILSEVSLFQHPQN